MCIKTQIQNFAKLLLVGVVLFAVGSVASRQALSQVSAKSGNNIATAGAAVENMFARAQDQTVPESPDYHFVDAACVKAAIPPVEITPKVLGVIVGESQNIEDEDKKPLPNMRFGTAILLPLWPINSALALILSPGLTTFQKVRY